jgi:hypothetical protein
MTQSAAADCPDAPSVADIAAANANNFLLFAMNLLLPETVPERYFFVAAIRLAQADRGAA